MKDSHVDPKENKKSDKGLHLSLGENGDEYVKYCKQHYSDMIVYIVLVLGIILLFFNLFYGGLLVGLVGGFYFGQQVIEYIKSIRNHIVPQDIVRHLTLAGVALAFFISAPSIFIGAAIAIIVKEIFADR